MSYMRVYYYENELEDEFSSASIKAKKIDADYDYSNLFLAVAPSGAFEFEMSYHERPDPLSDAMQVNWTTRNAPQLLLYACLLEAQPWLKNPAMLAMWQSQYAEMIAALQREEQGFNHDITEA